jgi:hypothetical protein
MIPGFRCLSTGKASDFPRQYWMRPVTTTHVCPKCQSRAIVRLGRGDVVDRLILKVKRKLPYRCLDCDHRFLDRPTSKQSRSP